MTDFFQKHLPIVNKPDGTESPIFLRSWRYSRTTACEKITEPFIFKTKLGNFGIRYYLRSSSSGFLYNIKTFRP